MSEERMVECESCGRTYKQESGTAVTVEAGAPGWRAAYASAPSTIATCGRARCVAVTAKRLARRIAGARRQQEEEQAAREADWRARAAAPRCTSTKRGAPCQFEAGHAGVHGNHEETWEP